MTRITRWITFCLPANTPERRRPVCPTPFLPPLSSTLMEDRPISNVFDTPNTAIHTPLPPDTNDAFILEPPRASHLFSDSSRTSYAPSMPIQSSNNSGLLLPMAGKTELDEYADEHTRPTKTSRKPLIFALVLAGLVVVVLAVVLPVYFTVIKPKNHANASGGSPQPTTSSTGGGGGSGGGNTSSTRVTTGGDGSTVTMDDGSTFIYSNKFGGFCTFFFFSAGFFLLSDLFSADNTTNVCMHAPLSAPQCISFSVLRFAIVSSLAIWCCRSRVAIIIKLQSFC